MHFFCIVSQNWPMVHGLSDAVQPTHVPVDVSHTVPPGLPTQSLSVAHMPPPLELVDPLVDVDAEVVDPPAVPAPPLPLDVPPVPPTPVPLELWAMPLALVPVLAPVPLGLLPEPQAAPVPITSRAPKNVAGNRSLLFRWCRSSRM
jgi:hypothetical protein